MNLRRKPTDAELAILRVLWSRGPSTVRDVAVEMGREGSYTTVLKLLQIMADKGLVRRDEAARSHVYQAAASEDDTQRQLVGDLLHRAFDGAAGKLVLRALEDGKVTPSELTEIRRLLNKRNPIDADRAKGEDK
jgi:BlaI family transcriptional regulator, penicillinase repressor